MSVKGPEPDLRLPNWLVADVPETDVLPFAAASSYADDQIMRSPLNNRYLLSLVGGQSQIIHIELDDAAGKIAGRVACDRHQLDVVIVAVEELLRDLLYPT